MDALVLHGGAGHKSELRDVMQKYAEEAFKNDALESVIQAVVFMEDDPLFNAGTGSNMRMDGSIQMDAAVMVPGDFGAVINIENVKNPVLVAKDVMHHSPHLILAGDGAVKFARKMGYPEYNPATEKARERRDKVIQELRNGKIPSYYHPDFLMEFLGDTVGAVARIDEKFAAAVSTGGTSLTLRGRVGDSPIIGAGIYCGENGAVVATGIGEEIIRHMLSLAIYNRIGTAPLEEICREEIEKFGDVPVGVIAVSIEEECAVSNRNMPYAILRMEERNR